MTSIDTETAPAPPPYDTDVKGYKCFDGAYAIVTWTTSWGGQASRHYPPLGREDR